MEIDLSQIRPGKRFKGESGIVRGVRIIQLKRLKERKPAKLAFIRYFEYLVMRKTTKVGLTEEERYDLYMILKLFPSWLGKAKALIELSKFAVTIVALIENEVNVKGVQCN